MIISFILDESHLLGYNAMELKVDRNFAQTEQETSSSEHTATLTAFFMPSCAARSSTLNIDVLLRYVC
jgi:hypothetical protein